MIEFYRDRFDSEMLGCEAYKLWLHEPVMSEDAVSALFADKQADVIFCFTDFVHSNLRALQRLNFDLISVRNTYALCARPDATAATMLPRPAPPDIELALASRAGHRIRQTDLSALAGVIGETSRYFKDAHIPRAACQRIYETWLNNSLFNGYAAESVLAFAGDVLVGIHTLKIQGTVGTVDLIGVLPQAQHGGLGGALLRAGFDLMRERGVGRVEVVTENENVAASRFYQKHGFKLQSMQLVWHKHVKHTMTT